MNNVYDLAHDLARSLKETDQYKNYAAVKARVDAEPSLAKMVNDFQEHGSADPDDAQRR